MKRLLERQSDLSIASALFYLAGGVLSVLSITVFHDGTHRPNPVRPFVAVASFGLAVAFIVRGRAFNRTLALVLLCVSAMFVLGLVFIASTELRAMNSGLLFYTILVYLVWFGPMWLARVFGYGWLAIYCTVVAIRFSEEAPLFLSTLVITTVILGELVGIYKNRLEASSLTDPLCEVWNKRAFEAALAKTVASAHRGGRPLSLMYLDLDGFKEVNDSLGHAEGDRILRDFARTIEANVRTQDVFGRLGGDEFALLLPDTTLEEAERIGRRLQSVATLTAWSFGAAQLLRRESVEQFTARADALMLARKRLRRAAG